MPPNAFSAKNLNPFWIAEVLAGCQRLLVKKIDGILDTLLFLAFRIDRVIPAVGCYGVAAHDRILLDQDHTAARIECFNRSSQACIPGPNNNNISLPVPLRGDSDGLQFFRE